LSCRKAAINFNMGTLVGCLCLGPRACWTMAAGLPGTKGLMLTFDDFLIGMEACSGSTSSR